MAIIITDECINCDACISECPNNAIYEPDTKWSYSDGSALKGMVKTPSRSALPPHDQHPPISPHFLSLLPT